jgi:hypothetical protein
MQWSEVIKPPAPKVLRQFAGLLLVLLVSLAAWRVYTGRADAWAATLALVGVVAGGVGLAWPAAMRPIFTGWMIAAFPIGWTVSRVVLGIVFFLVITPIGWVFRLRGRDLLALRRPSKPTYWQPKRPTAGHASYFRQF